MLSICSPVSQAEGMATDSGTAQGKRSVFLPPEFEAAEVSGSWQHGLTAIVLLVWLIVGLVLCVRTFRWQRRDAG